VTRGLKRIAAPSVLLVATLLALSNGVLIARGAASGHRGRATTTHLGPVLPLYHAGRWITDARGRVVILHGTNMVYKLAPYYPAAIGFGPSDAKFLRRIGFNAVRVGVIWKGLEPKPGVFNAKYVAQIKATVTMLAHYGIVSLLDFHQDMLNELFQGEGFPDWAIQTGGLPNPKLGFSNNYLANPALEHALDQFFDNAAGPDGVGLQQYYAGAWADVAKAFKSVKSVVGYELMNEPFPGTLWEQCVVVSGCPLFDAKLLAFYKRVDAAIRKVDHRTLVWYEPNVIFNDGVNTALGPLGDPNAGFAFHDYCLAEPANNSSATNPACDAEDALVFANAVHHVRQTHDALLETEFGATNDVPELADLVSRADANRVPWLEWAFCGCNDPTTQGPGSVQAMVLNPAKPATGTNVEWNTVRALTEPYPQVISGTPLAYGYNHATQTFTFSYTTAGAAGGRFPAGAITQVATPSLDYPHGYLVKVLGAKVVSRKNAAVLQLASRHGAKTIRVTVTPN
jgi:endoglycosylceramidase